MKLTILSALLLLAGTTASFAIDQPPTKLDPQNLRTYSYEMNQQAALDQARRDTGTGLEGPSVVDSTQTTRTAQLDRNSDYGDQDGGRYTPFNGYHGDM